MRFRAGILLCVFSLLVAVGCRKPLTPNVDRNQAPETWITAAPQDTITPRDAAGNPVGGAPSPSSIAFRYHVYWAGSDQDGTVVGYYIAVVDTVPTPGLGEPGLPGPKPRDYHYTTRSDSTLIFSVFRDRPDRQHAFFVYAVDNAGKSDATPARFIFNAVDQYPPIPVIDSATGTADIFDINDLVPGVDLPLHRVTKAIRDTFVLGKSPRDTIAANSRLVFRWHDEERITNNPAVKWQYKLVESNFVEQPASADSAVYEPNTFGVGTKLFTLFAVDTAGGARTSPTTTRYFQVNFSPDTWFAGPDPTPPTNPTYYTNPANRPRDRYRDIAAWPAANGSFAPTDFPGSYLTADSAKVLPKDRIPRRTFFEFYKDRAYVRAEDDTVHLNSWVLFFGGGFDCDSPYSVRVNNFAIDTTKGAVFHRRPANGSPIGFRLLVPVYLTPSGAQSGFPQTTLFPLDEALTPPEAHVGGYLPMQQSGLAFAALKAEDGNGGLDQRLPFNLKAFVDSVESGLLNSIPERKALRSRVIRYYVNKAPFLINPAAVTSGAPGGVYATRVLSLTGLNSASDEDPYDQTQRKPGGPPPSQPTPVSLRYTVYLKGTYTAGGVTRDTTYLPPVGYFRTTVAPNLISVPDYMTGTSVRIVVELCDFPTEGYFDGQGRCRNYEFPVTVPPPPGAALTPAQALYQRPGNSNSQSGSNRP